MRKNFASTLIGLAFFLGVGDLASAGSVVTITFSGLADGEVIHSYTSDGFTLSSTLGFDVIGPGDPNYLGSTGLAPIGGASSGWTVAATDGSSWILTDLGFGLGAVPTGSGDVALLVVGYEGGVPRYEIGFDTDTVGYDPNLPQNDLPPTDELIVKPQGSLSAPYQFTRLTLGLAAVPEPPSWVCLVSGVGAVLAWRSRRSVV